jgi:hypothetical protein
LEEEADMIGWWWVACATQEPTLRSTPTKPTAALASAAVVVPADSPLAQFVPAGAPAELTGPLGTFRLGTPELEARRIADALASPRRRPPEANPAPGVSVVGGELDGFDHLGFMVTLQDGRVSALDVTAPLNWWEGVLEVAWGPPAQTHTPSGLPGAVWQSPDLHVTLVNAGDGQAVVRWERPPAQEDR